MPPTQTERLRALWDHLGLHAAHVAAQAALDFDHFAEANPDRIAGCMICLPPGLDPAPFAALAERVVFVAGEHGGAAKVADAALAGLPGSRRVLLADYEPQLWTDCVAERRADFIAALRGLPGAASVPAGLPTSGAHAGISYQVRGCGPALVLFPFYLAPSQWDPAIAALAEHFTVIVLGGRHVGGVALLEGRSLSHSYMAMVHTMVDAMAPATGDTILEVGCGSGALTRSIARRLGIANPITAIDINPFLLREATALAHEDGVDGEITFREGNAECLPFSDATFDHAFTVTVLEECDAAAALRELRRVVKPGGRVGVIVRATDMAQTYHVDVPDKIRRKAEIPVQWVGPAGVAGYGLYRRMIDAGFAGLLCSPSMVSYNDPGSMFWRFSEAGVLARLSSDELTVWRAANLRAREDGVLFRTGPYHVAVGHRPLG